MATSPTSLPGLDLRARRDRLLEIHSILRSADNLRPDEAFDQLVTLYSVWLNAGPASFAESREIEPGLALSAGAFERATELLGPMLIEGRLDTGADVFQELADVGVRAGLGQYFTPTPVAAAMVAYLRPCAGESWIDPFCGSGLLLGELAAASDGPLRLFGVDRDARVLRLAQLAATSHHADSPLKLVQTNSLSPLEALHARLDTGGAPFDGVVTNPPFGAEVHPDDQRAYGEFFLASPQSTPLEILGLERSLQLLRPGGRLGIVLPQSVLSNRGSKHVRSYLLESCYVDGVLSLPPDTFGPYRGVGKAAVVFAQKHAERRGGHRTALAVARSIGWDSTGRATKTPEDVTLTAKLLRTGAPVGTVASVSDVADLQRNMTPEWHLRPRAVGTPLGELASAIFTGRTPGRAAYAAAEMAATETVYRVLKVGDLTNSGIDWTPGERSCAAFPRPVISKLIQVSDIALTAAAHHPRYIGAKVDLVDMLPPEFEERVFACAEVLVIRPDPALVDPVVLLLWLRTNDGREALQACVTGQTAHLYPQEVAEIVVPGTVLTGDHRAAVALVRRSLVLRRESELAAAQARADFVSLLSLSPADDLALAS